MAEEDEGPQARDVTEVHACQIDMDISGLIGEAVQRGDQVRMSDRIHVPGQAQQVPGIVNPERPAAGNHLANRGTLRQGPGSPSDRKSQEDLLSLPGWAHYPSP